MGLKVVWHLFCNDLIIAVICTRGWKKKKKTSFFSPHFVFIPFFIFPFYIPHFPFAMSCYLCCSAECYVPPDQNLAVISTTDTNLTDLTHANKFTSQSGKDVIAVSETRLPPCSVQAAHSLPRHFSFSNWLFLLDSELLHAPEDQCEDIRRRNVVLKSGKQCCSVQTWTAKAFCLSLLVHCRENISKCKYTLFKNYYSSFPILLKESDLINSIYTSDVVIRCH